MLNRSKKYELKDYFEGFTAEEMEEVIKVAQEVTETKRKEEYIAELNELKSKLKHFIETYGYLDFSSEAGVEFGLGESAILLTNEQVPNTIFFQYPD